MPAAPSRRTARRAFTLIELAITMLVMGILAGVAVPRYADAILEARVRAAAYAVAADVEHARRQAIVRGRSQRVVFHDASDSYTLIGLPHPDHPSREWSVRLAGEPYGAAISSVTPGQIVFNAFGRLGAGGKLVVTVGAKSRTVSVDAVTGGVSVSR